MLRVVVDDDQYSDNRQLQSLDLPCLNRHSVLQDFIDNQTPTFCKVTWGYVVKNFPQSISPHPRVHESTRWLLIAGPRIFAWPCNHVNGTNTVNRPKAMPQGA